MAVRCWHKDHLRQAGMGTTGDRPGSDTRDMLGSQGDNRETKLDLFDGDGKVNWIHLCHIHVLLQVNLAQETLRGLLSHWLSKRRQRSGSQAAVNGDMSAGRDVAIRNHSHAREADDSVENQSPILPSFEFSTVSPPSIITEGSQGGPWRKKLTELDGTEDEKDFPWWCLDCVLNGRIPPRENTKCSFYLHPCEGSNIQLLTQGKLSAPRILRIHKVINYVIEKMVLDKPLEGGSSDGTFGSGLSSVQSQFSPTGNGAFRAGLKPWQKLKPSIEILCNNQARYI
ncbi:hypothetical protein Taro_032771 [Colocasia esculenta]|uniref:Uncharacterized protein n=1 Tax=Colocasia esculenta TaxID=4460 RepID=A0A843VZY0_COLES|nr:hypothetical protein [Colocasia esculenta]